MTSTGIVSDNGTNLSLPPQTAGHTAQVWEVLAPNCKQSEAHLKLKTKTVVIFGNLSLFVVILSIPSSGDIIFREKNRSFIW